MPPRSAIRYNEKARGRPHKKRKLNRRAKMLQRTQAEDDVTPDTNETINDQEAGPSKSDAVDFIDPTLEVELIVPKTQEEKERDRKERMMLEMIGTSQSKWNTKKKRRLEAYIAKKLKKEERLQIFERLSKSQSEIDPLHLQSSSTLGSGKPYTHAHRLALEEDHAVRRAINVHRKRKPFDGVDDPDEFDADSEKENEDAESDDDSPWGGVGGELTTSSEARLKPANQLASGVGSGLRRNEDGTVATPRIIKKKPKRKPSRRAEWNPNLHNPSARAMSEGSTSSSPFDSSAASSQSGSGSDIEGNGSDASEHSEPSDSSSDSETEDSSDNGRGVGQKRKRASGFKEWAQRQLNAAKEVVMPPQGDLTTEVSTLPTDYYAHLPEHLRKRQDIATSDEKFGALGEKLELPNTSLAKHIISQTASSKTDKDVPKKTTFASVDRPPDVQESRLKLPILSEEQVVVETIRLHPVVIICGETGSGKTTQVPQFLFEAGFGSPTSDNPGMIGITQPRRVAAMSMASRVAHELSLSTDRVSYQIRYDATVSPTTSIKFMTDGVLLRELAVDFLLTKYSVIIIDEAHERSMNTDILIGVLSRVMKLRDEMWQKNKDSVKPLRIIIMSATLRVSDFAENTTLFPTPPPILNVEARQYPVTVHYNRRTTHDYVEQAVKKAIKIHARLPPGGILIFLTGQNEIHAVCKKLERRFGKRVIDEKERLRKEAFGSTGLKERLKPWIEKGQDELEDTKAENMTVAARNGDIEADEVDIGVSDDLAVDDTADGEADRDSDALDSDSDSPEGSDDGEDEIKIDTDDSDVPMHIVPLYSLLPKEKQMKVFETPPAGHRLVVVATNVAETSLTIPGISYVVDAGRAKKRLYDTQTGIESYRVDWISKASAAQRAGRAGRTGPGHCYCLYSSAFYENTFPQFDEPEILRMPIEGIVLSMKAMHIDAVINFPFPTPPNRDALRKAEKTLTHLGALQSLDDGVVRGTNAAYGGKITDLGRSMALFPISPRFSKLLAIGRQKGCLPYVIAMVAGLSVGDPFLREEDVGIDIHDADDEGEDDVSMEVSTLHSDKLKEKEIRKSRRRAYFKAMQLHSKLGSFTSDVFRILSVVGAYEYDGGRSQFCDEHFVRPKAMEEIHKLRAQLSHIVQTNFTDADGAFSPKLPPPDATQIKVLRQLLAAAFIDRVAVRKDVVDKDSTTSGLKFASCRGVAYRAMDIDEDVFIHPSSVVYHGTPPDWIVYQDIVRSSRVWMKGITTINPAWLPTLGPTFCTFSKPLDLPLSLRKIGADIKVVTPHFGPHRWQLPNTKI